MEVVHEYLWQRVRVDLSRGVREVSLSEDKFHSRRWHQTYQALWWTLGDQVNRPIGRAVHRGME